LHGCFKGLKYYKILNLIHTILKSQPSIGSPEVILMKREYPQRPIVAVGGIIFHEDTVLLVKRNREPAMGQWSLPGGAVELGERLEEALKREIREEVSIKIEIGGLVRLLDRVLHDKKGEVRFHYVIADYWGWRVSGQPHAASDVSEARFVSLKEARKLGIQKEVEATILMAMKMRDERKAI
jgi:8-oxo-dGTP diphosphatase